MWWHKQIQNGFLGQITRSAIVFDIIAGYNRRLTPKPQVAGSNPAAPASFYPAGAAAIHISLEVIEAARFG
jgi:hypothetical protein